MVQLFSMTILFFYPGHTAVLAYLRYALPGLVCVQNSHTPDISLPILMSQFQARGPYDDPIGSNPSTCLGIWSTHPYRVGGPGVSQRGKMGTKNKEGLQKTGLNKNSWGALSGRHWQPYSVPGFENWLRKFWQGPPKPRVPGLCLRGHACLDQRAVLLHGIRVCK